MSMIYSWLYSRFMRFLHRHDQHWFTKLYSSGDMLLWCRWCGLSYGRFGRITRLSTRIKPTLRTSTND